MASPYRRNRKVRKRKKSRQGQARKRKLRREGSTPDLNKVLGPIGKTEKSS